MRNGRPWAGLLVAAAALAALRLDRARTRTSLVPRGC